MYDMVKKIIGRSWGSPGSPALLPAASSPHCCVLLSPSCRAGPLQGMGAESGALPLRWHLPRQGQPDPSSEQVSWFWALSRAGSSTMGFSTAPKCIPGAALQSEAGAFGLGKAWTQLRLSRSGTWGWYLCSATGVMSLEMCCPCSVQQCLGLAWFGLVLFGLLGPGASCVLCSICWVSPFPAILAGSKPDQNNSRTGYWGSSAVVVGLGRGQVELCSWSEMIWFGVASGWVWCFLRLVLVPSQTGVVVEVIALWVVGLKGCRAGSWWFAPFLQGYFLRFA